MSGWMVIGVAYEPEGVLALYTSDATGAVDDDSFVATATAIDLGDDVDAGLYELHLGHWSGGVKPWPGHIDELRLVHGAGHVALPYTAAPVAPASSETVGLWHFGLDVDDTLSNTAGEGLLPLGLVAEDGAAGDGRDKWECPG
jgi:hypothetical protein